MKKKILSVILSIFMFVPCMFFLTACGNNGGGNNGGGNNSQSQNLEFSEYETMIFNIATSYDVNLGGNDSNNAVSANSSNANKTMKSAIFNASPLTKKSALLANENSLEKPIYEQIFDSVNGEADKVDANEKIGRIMDTMYGRAFYYTLAAGKCLRDSYNYTNFYGVTASGIIPNGQHEQQGYYIVKKIDDNNFKLVSLIMEKPYDSEINQQSFLSSAMIVDIFYVDKSNFKFEYRNYEDYGKLISYAYGDSDSRFVYSEYSKINIETEKWEDTYQNIIFDGTNAFETQKEDLGKQVQEIVFNAKKLNAFLNECRALQYNKIQIIENEKLNDAIAAYAMYIYNDGEPGVYFDIRNGVLYDFDFIDENRQLSGIGNYGSSTLVIPNNVKGIYAYIRFPADVEKVIVPETVEYFYFEEEEQKAIGYPSEYIFSNIDPLHFDRQNIDEIEKNCVTMEYSNNCPAYKVVNGNVFVKSESGKDVLTTVNDMPALCKYYDIEALGTLVIDPSQYDSQDTYDKTIDIVKETLEKHNCYLDYNLFDKIVDYSVLDIVIDCSRATGYDSSLTYDMVPQTINSLTIKNIKNDFSLGMIARIGEIEIKEINVQDVSPNSCLSIYTPGRPSDAQMDLSDEPITTKIGKINLCEGIVFFKLEGKTITDETSFVVPEYVEYFGYQPICSGDFELTLNRIISNGRPIDPEREILIPKVPKNHTLTINTRKDEIATNLCLESKITDYGALSYYWDYDYGNQSGIGSGLRCEDWKKLFSEEYSNVVINFAKPLPLLVDFKKNGNKLNVGYEEDIGIFYELTLSTKVANLNLLDYLELQIPNQVIEYKNELNNQEGTGYLIPLTEGRGGVALTYFMLGSNLKQTIYLAINN